MLDAATDDKLKVDLLGLYTRYFGSITADSYKKFYSDKDMKTVLLSAEELMVEYAGETKGKQIIADLTKKYNIQKN